MKRRMYAVAQDGVYLDIWMKLLLDELRDPRPLSTSVQGWAHTMWSSILSQPSRCDCPNERQSPIPRHEH